MPSGEGRREGGTTLIRWKEPSTFEEIMGAYDKLIAQGWKKPPVRTLFYQLSGDHPERWIKKDLKQYKRLTVFLEKKRERA